MSQVWRHSMSMYCAAGQPIPPLLIATARERLQSPKQQRPSRPHTAPLQRAQSKPAGGMCTSQVSALHPNKVHRVRLSCQELQVLDQLTNTAVRAVITVPCTEHELYICEQKHTIVQGSPFTPHDYSIRKQLSCGQCAIDRASAIYAVRHADALFYAGC